eukprot:8429888-Karenia_brevis.AAC.1
MTCANVLEASKLEMNSKARIEASKPGATDPATPGVDTDDAKARRVKELKDRHKDTACPRMVKSDKCAFGDDCYYSHKKKVIAAAKTALEAKGK